MQLLDYCRSFPQQTFEAGEIVMAEGAQTGCLYVLIDGTVEITRGDLVLNTVSDPGSPFGEISVLLEAPHIATVRTLTQSRFYRVERPLEFIRATPEVCFHMTTLLAQRVRSVSNHVANMREVIGSMIRRQTDQPFAQKDLDQYDAARFIRNYSTPAKEPMEAE